MHLLLPFLLIPVGAWLFDTVVQFNVQLIYGAVTNGALPRPYRLGPPAKLLLTGATAILWALVIALGDHPPSLLVFTAFLVGIAWVLVSSAFAIGDMQTAEPPR